MYICANWIVQHPPQVILKGRGELRKREHPLPSYYFTMHVVAGAVVYMSATTLVHRPPAKMFVCACVFTHLFVWRVLCVCGCVGVGVGFRICVFAECV